MQNPEKYNYVIAGGDGFYKFAYSDLDKLDNVCFFRHYKEGVESNLMRLLISINFNLKVNQLIKTPLKSLTFPQIYPHGFGKERPLCFIFFGAQYAVINTSYIEYLRKRYPDARLVLYMQDVVRSLPYYDIQNYKRRFDLVLSYDRGDCDNYSLTYYPTPFSHIDVSKLKSETPVDIYFCGSAKSRYPEIFDAFRKAKDEGLSCRFFITGVPDHKRIISDDIIYDRKLSYIENLSHAASAKCILEVMQKDADGFTPRLWEAMTLNKHLLTNNSALKESRYYNEKSIHFFSSSPIRAWIDKECQYSEALIKEKSPVNLLHFIEASIP